MYAFTTIPARVTLAATVIAAILVLGSAGSAPTAAQGTTDPVAGASSTHGPMSYGAGALTEPARVRVTLAEVETSNQKAAMAYGALVNMWQGEFARIGERFVAPELARYRGAIRTRCGVISPSNASYCLAANSIYYDDVFLAGQGKVAARALGTDGDMAAVGIIAHEMGHAVAMQLGFRARDSYTNESVADCFAGAFAKRSGLDGSLETGDIEEAFFGMASAADPLPGGTGSAELDLRLAAHIARNSHGSREQRMNNFQSGLNGGSGACMSRFQQ